jgi:D-3-phosphoglycerate dehydrogenase / 2-oxoglutarate reductase
MASPIAIASKTSPRVVAASISPSSTASLHERFHINVRQPKVLHPVENEDLRLLVLENISAEAVAAFRSQGFQVDHHMSAWGEDELVEKIGSYHAIGIRSKTKITERVIKAASKVRFVLLVYSPNINRGFSAARNRLLLHRH